VSVPDAGEQQDALFVNLVLMFQSAAMQQMGKISNLMTGQVEKNLDQARFSIDMLEMLKTKTRGNLSPEIGKLLDSTLTNLRLNYVDEADKSAREKAGSKSGETHDAEAGADSAEGGKAPRSEGTEGAQADQDSASGEEPASGGQAT
jgi:hypothetical protein